MATEPGTATAAAAAPTFAQLIRQFRLAGGLSQEQLAERAGLSVAAVNTLERGTRRAPRADTVARLIRGLGLPPADRERLAAAVRRSRSTAPARSAAGRPRAPLPLPLTSFVGRERELAAARCLLGSARLLTLTGPGGTGKTRLALRLAADLDAEYADGIALVELAALADPDLVPSAIAAVLGIGLEAGQPATATLAWALRDRRLLLLLDNCEHVLDACAGLAEALLVSCPRLQVLATSRQALGVAGEVNFLVLPLALPPCDADGSAAACAAAETVRLFLDRAVAARPAFTLTDQNAVAVAEVCRRLEGLPLAIELAAAQTRLLAPRQIADRLDDRFLLLAGGSRAAPRRQRTLRATIDWSYHLLAEPERALFRRLAVFAGGWTLEAAEAVGARDGIERGQVLPLLAQLADASLVLVEERGGEARYRLLETLREYGRERLAEAGEADAAQRRLLDWARRLVEAAWAEGEGPRETDWLDVLEAERANLESTLAWCLEREPAAGLDVAWRLARFWLMRGYRAEGRRWLEQLLAAAPARTPTRARALFSAGMLAEFDFDVAANRVLLEECLEMAREVADTWSEAKALLYLGMREANLARARGLLEESLTLLQQLGDGRGSGEALRRLAELAQWQEGDRERARELYEQGLVLARARGDRLEEAFALINLGKLYGGYWDPRRARALNGDDLQRARGLLEAALAIFRTAGQRRATIGAYLALGGLARDGDGDYDGAQRWYEEALALARRTGDRPAVEMSLWGLGHVRRLRGEQAEADRLYDQALTQARERGNVSVVASPLRLSGSAAAAAGDLARAQALDERGLALCREHGLPVYQAMILGDLGGLAQRRGESAQAATLWHESLLTARSAPLGDRYYCRVLGSMGSLAVRRGDAAGGTRLHAAAQAALPIFRRLIDNDDLDDWAASLAAARATLGEVAFAAAWAEGQAMSLAQAVAHALELHPSSLPVPEVLPPILPRVPACG